MNLSKAQKKILKENYKELSLSDLAEKTGLSEDTIKKYLKKFGKEPVLQKPQKNIKNEVNSSIMVLNPLLIIRSNLDFIILLSIITCAVYFRTFFANFVTADDVAGFIQNPITQNLNAAVNSAVLHSIYYAVIFKVAGFNPYLMHTISLIAHLAISAMVFVLIYLLFGKKTAYITSILFAVHPVNVESVSWISGVGYLINGLFALPMLITYAFYRRTLDKRYFWISFGIFVSALVLVRLPWVLTAFAGLLLLDQFVFEKKINFKSLINIWPFFAASAIYLITYLRTGAVDRLVNLSSNFGLHAEESEPLINRIPYTIFMMLKLYVFPKDLSIFHEGIGISLQLYITMIIITIIFAVVILVLWKINRLYAGLAMGMIASIAPTLSPVQVAFFIAERYMYFGTIFFCAILALIFISAEKRFKYEGLALYLTIFLVLIYSLRTFVRVNDWQNSKNLWLSTSKIASTSARVYNNLGDAYGTEGNVQESIKAFERAIELQPNYADAMHNLGNTYLQINELDLAENYIMQSWEINPSLYQSTFKLGVIEYRRGNLEKALEYFEKTLEINPNDIESPQAIQIIKSQMSQ